MLKRWLIGLIAVSTLGAGLLVAVFNGGLGVDSGQGREWELVKTWDYEMTNTKQLFRRTGGALVVNEENKYLIIAHVVFDLIIHGTKDYLISDTNLVAELLALIAEDPVYGRESVIEYGSIRDNLFIVISDRGKGYTFLTRLKQNQTTWNATTYQVFRSEETAPPWKIARVLLNAPIGIQYALREIDKGYIYQEFVDLQNTPK